MERDGNRPRWTGSRLFALIPAVALLAGCNSSDSSTGEREAAVLTDAKPSADEIAEQMLAVYRKAPSYADRATYVQHSVHRAEGVERDLPFFHMSLAFERPNRLRLAFEEAVESSAGSQGFNVASDGMVIRSTAGGLPGQVHEAAAPSQLTTENFLPDPYLREVFQERQLGDVFPQLAMLLNKQDGEAIFPRDEPPVRLEDQELRGRKCFRIASTSPDGKRVLWIDSNDYTLMRMELPIDAQRETLNPDSSYSQLSVWIDFEDISLGADVDDVAFKMAPPKDARRVRHFILPPPAPPRDILGKPVAPFKFVSTTGDPVTSESLAGKTVLIEFWQLDCAPCKAQTPRLEQLYGELKEDQNFACYAVSIDPPARAANDVVEATLREWGGTMPVLRDPAQSAVKQLQVGGTPTLMLLDAKGRLQLFHEGEYREPDQLKSAVQRVLAGGDMAAQALAEHRQMVKDYEQELELVTIKDEIVELPIAQRKVSERRLPAKLQAAELWKTAPDLLSRPGNILSIHTSTEGASESPPRILVIDGSQAIVELDAEGKEVGRHDLARQSGDGDANGLDRFPPTGFLRTAIDDSGRRFIAASGVGWQKLQVFDDQWKTVCTFPTGRHPGIADFALAAYGPSAEPRLCVGYWGGVGLQGVGLDGKRKWSERTLEQVVQIVAPAADPSGENPAPEYWCTSNRGTIFVVDENGKPKREVAVGLRALMYFAVDDLNDDGQRDCCGLALRSLGHYQVVGFTPDGAVDWQYDLPPAEYSTQVERIQAVDMPNGDKAWMIAAPDGTIHWLSAAGEPIDQFACGEPLSGASLTRSSETAILLISTPSGVTAWKLTGP